MYSPTKRTSLFALPNTKDVGLTTFAKVTVLVVVRVTSPSSVVNVADNDLGISCEAFSLSTIRVQDMLSLDAILKYSLLGSDQDTP